jgi:hypothetical protein
MESRIGRGAYVVLLRLHPRGFRHDFAGEMLQVFEEASETYGAGWLVADAALSLVRQRLLRWPEESALSPANDVPAGLLAGIYPEHGAPHLTIRKLVSAFCLSILFFSLIDPTVMPALHQGKQARSNVHSERPFGRARGSSR